MIADAVLACIVIDIVFIIGRSYKFENADRHSHNCVCECRADEQRQHRIELDAAADWVIPEREVGNLLPLHCCQIVINDLFLFYRHHTKQLGL